MICHLLLKKFKVPGGFEGDSVLNVVLMLILIGPRCTWGPIYGSGLSKSVRHIFADLTDVTLADKDTESILNDNVTHKLNC